MPVYLINSYDIDDFEEFKNYPPKVKLILQKYGAEVLASDINGEALEGTAKTMNAIIKFPSKETAIQCYNDPEYQAIKHFRLDSTSNCTMVLVNQFE